MPRSLKAEPDSGDEKAIRYRVTIRVSKRRTTVEPPAIASFLAADFAIINRTKRRAVVRVARVGRRAIAPGATGRLSTPGLKTGRYRIKGPGGNATLIVRAGG